MRIHRDERGQTLILVALSLPLILGFVGMATDVGLLFMDKRQIQTAADAAAIAGALNLHYPSSYADAGKAASAANGYTDGTSGVTVLVHEHPTWTSSNYLGLSGYVEATVSKNESTIFLVLFGHPTVTVTARAVATNQAPGSACLYTLGTSGTTFRNNGTVDVEATNCGLVVESSDLGAMTLHGSSDTVNLGSIAIVGGDSLSGHPSFPTAQPVTGVAPSSDPLNYLPQYSLTSVTTGHGSKAVTTYSVSCASGYDCSGAPAPGSCATNTSSGYDVPVGATLSPGCYANLSFPSSGTVTLNPGLYLVNGDVSFGSGTINGSGVTLYTNGNFNFGSGKYNLTAPNDTSQLYNGVLFAESLDNTNGITFGGNATSVIKGVVYAPNGSFNMHGNPSITLYADFVVHDITLSGNVSFNSYASVSGVSNPLTSIALVE